MKELLLMLDQAHLMSFVAVAAVLVIVPGPNTVLIVSNGVAGGRSAGLATVLGVETGTLVHTLAAAFGISAVLATSPAAYGLVQYGGAAYLATLGIRTLVTGGRGLDRAPLSHHTHVKQTYRRALLMSVLNPKAAVFFLALLPQFVDRERGHVLLQFMVLGSIVSIIGLLVGITLTLAITGGLARRWLHSQAVRRWEERLSGAILIGLGARLALSEAI